MKIVKMFIQRNCPYCRRALDYWLELKTDGLYEDIELEIIDELIERDLANSYNYYYVPSIYFQEEKYHEGVLEKKTLIDVLNRINQADEK